MNYITFEVGSDSYKLRLTTRGVLELEKRLGQNPLNIFIENGKERIPTITEMVAVLHASLQQYNHGITMNDACDIFDKYLDSGKATTDFIPVILEVYKASGIIPKENDEENAIKNA